MLSGPLRSPRLERRDRPISTFLIRVVATPFALLISFLIMLNLWHTQYFYPFTALAGVLISILDLISNAYQEVSADHRHNELLARLDQLDALIPKG